MRRFLSRFLAVVVVVVVIEGLVATFKAVTADLEQLFAVASGLVAAGILLAGWGLFIRTNAVAEQLEPEAMAQLGLRVRYHGVRIFPVAACRLEQDPFGAAVVSRGGSLNQIERSSRVRAMATTRLIAWRVRNRVCSPA